METGKRYTSHKKIYIEAIRLLAIFLVLYCHTSVDGLLYFMQGKGNKSAELSIFLYPLALGCVLLFFMISGAVLLPRLESIGQIMKKRFSRFLLVTVLVVFLYAYLGFEEPFSVEGAFRALYSSGSMTQHWYLYAHLSFLLILPFLQRMVAGITDSRYFLYLWGIGIFLKTFCGFFEKLVGLESFGIYSPFLTDIIFYPLLGYYIDSYLLPRIRERSTHRKIGWILVCFIPLVLIFLLWIEYRYDAASYAARGTLDYAAFFQPILFPLIYLEMGLLFPEGKVPFILQKVLIFMGSGVFGTYLLEPIIRDRLFFLLEDWVYQIPEYLACMLWIVCCVLVGIVISNLLKLIPGVKKFL